MKVKAITEGVYNNRMYTKGETFEVPDNLRLGKWMKKIEQPVLKNAPAPTQPPVVPPAITHISKPGDHE